MENQNDQDELSLAFSSKDDILDWGKNKYGPSFFGKFDDLIFNGKYLVFYANFGHGIIYTDIYILSHKSNIDKPWKIEKKKTTKYKYNFAARYDEDRREILVTSEDGELILVFSI